MELRLMKEMGYDRKASPTPNLSTFELLLDCGHRACDILIATSPGSDS